MHIEHIAGDKMYIDYAGEKLHLVDKETGEITEVEVFIAVLGASQLTYVEATQSMQGRLYHLLCACPGLLRWRADGHSPG